MLALMLLSLIAAVNLGGLFCLLSLMYFEHREDEAHSLD